MKTKFLLVTLVIALGAFAWKPETKFVGYSPYCEGWEAGYCEGWKDVKGQLALCPVTPNCPIPEIDTNTYRGGYNRAFKQGRKDALK